MRELYINWRKSGHLENSFNNFNSSLHFSNKKFLFLCKKERAVLLKLNAYLSYFMRIVIENNT